jgi:Fe-S oxidoreductase
VYAQLGACNFEVKHAVVMLADLVKQKKLVPKNPVNMTVTYHDPCHLVRAQGVSEAPRKILKALPQFEYVEMEDAGACCGGGGSFQFDFPGVSKGITEKKIPKGWEMRRLLGKRQYDLFLTPSNCSFITRCIRNLT